MRPFIAVMPLLWLAACDDPPSNGNLSNVAIEERASVPRTPRADGDEGNRAGVVDPSGNAAEAEPTRSANERPAASLDGRWGQTIADCSGDPAVAKGLLVIRGDQLRFYEAVAVADRGAVVTPTSMDGRFAFSGEGMEWHRTMRLSVVGDRLRRADRQPDAVYEYRRCAP